MLMAALEAEAADYVERHRHERDDEARALVVRNGRSQGRKLTLGTGTVELRTPRVNDRRRDEQGQRQRFSSRILRPTCGVRPRWPRCCRFYICAGFPPAISAPGRLGPEALDQTWCVLFGSDRPRRVRGDLLVKALG
jgi:hypothetical protein